MPTDESLPSLAPSLMNILVVLMAEGRDLNNNELKLLAGSSLTGKVNVRSNCPKIRSRRWALPSSG